MREQFLKGLVEKETINKEDGTLSVAIATDASTDRDGEIVDPAGLDTSNFERNPVLLYAHDYRSDPIGKVLSIRRDGSRVLFTPQFAINISERAKQYFEMYKEGFLNAFSIGFIPREWKDQQDADGSMRRIFTKTELLEISAVPVPANPNALVLAREYSGMKFDNEILEAMEKQLKPDQYVELSTRIDAIEKNVKDASEAVVSMKDSIDTVQKTLADNGEKGQKATKVEELLRHPEFQRGVLTAVDKALGVTLRDMNKASGAR